MTIRLELTTGILLGFLSKSSEDSFGGTRKDSLKNGFVRAIVSEHGAAFYIHQTAYRERTYRDPFLRIVPGFFGRGRGRDLSVRPKIIEI